jgi:iron-sulfur cluster repair protein YtfE (RIC family)
MSPASATAHIRAARERIRERLGELAVRVGALREGRPAGRRAEMRAVVDELDGALRPHLRWEEETVHPVVDKFACEGPAAFSASMRYEHEIIHRWSADLARLAERDDAFAFARRADNLLGVVLAHFELEEEVLFPILDRSLRADAPGWARG